MKGSRVVVPLHSEHLPVGFSAEGLASTALATSQAPAQGDWPRENPPAPQAPLAKGLPPAFGLLVPPDPFLEQLLQNACPRSLGMARRNLALSVPGQASVCWGSHARGSFTNSRALTPAPQRKNSHCPHNRKQSVAITRKLPLCRNAENITVIPRAAERVPTLTLRQVRGSHLTLQPRVYSTAGRPGSPPRKLLPGKNGPLE